MFDYLYEARAWSITAENTELRKISAGRSAWLTDELDAWSRGRPVSDLLPPVGSGYGRAGKVAA